MSLKNHWDEVYGRKRPDEVSWFRPHLDISLRFIRDAGIAQDARILDVGGGASTLVDDLLSLHYTNVAVADIAESALEASRQRLGSRAEDVDWIRGDVTSPLIPPASVDFWHDRAVFHFLVENDARDAYLAQVTRCVKSGGHVLVATFGLDGPDKCSGLPTMRYDSAGIKAAFGPSFTKIGQARENHQTPWGSEQAFVYCFCIRVA